ncbi:MAG TPA: S1 RNA-binding domain-containing protein [Pirellulaceae bacterium]|nr:S1 RNA-binding domain-containing protein [Pirellulaceae bacterium]
MTDSQTPDDALQGQTSPPEPQAAEAPVETTPSPAPIEAHVPPAAEVSPAGPAAEATPAEGRPSELAERAGEAAAAVVVAAVGAAQNVAHAAGSVAGTVAGSIAHAAKEALLARAKPSEKPAEAKAEAEQPKKIPVVPSSAKPKPPERVAVPSLRRKDEDLEAELEGLIGEAMTETETLEAVLKPAGEEGKKVGKPLEIDERIRGIVHRVQEESTFFNLGSYEGFAPTRQFKKTPEPGEMMDVVIVGYHEEDGIYEVTIPGAAVSVEDWSDLQVGQLVDAKIVGTNTGGLDASVNNIRGFVPASQISVGRTEDFNQYLGKKLLCEITEVNPGRKRLVLSHRRVVEKEIEALKEENFKTMEVGQVVEGTVTRIQDFGAFVDIGGGVEGLLHISKLSWDNVKHPSDVLSERQKVTVKIDRIQADKGRIGLSLRDLQENPWDRVVEKFPVGQILDGEVTRIMDFGVFVKLEPGIEGLIHVSEIAHHRVLQPRGHAKIGEQVQVKVLAVEPEKRRISLSKKAVMAAPAPKGGEKKKDDEGDSPAERTVKPAAGELKGGRGSSGDGERFGLKW